MPGLYDRLKNQIGDDDDNDKSSGLTPLDITELPEDQRRVMLVLLRDPQASSEGMTQTTLSDRLDNPANLSTILSELTKNSWLIELGEAPGIRYKVNLRRKRGSASSTGMWASLIDHLTDDDASESPPGGPTPNDPQDHDTNSTTSSHRPSVSDW